MKRMITMILVGVALAGCATGPSGEQNSRSSDPQAIIGRTWQWVATVTPIEKITVAEPGKYTMLLMADGKAQVRFDCNRGGGNYQIADGKLSFGPLMSTRMACSPDSLDAPFMRDL